MNDKERSELISQEADYKEAYLAVLIGWLINRDATGEPVLADKKAHEIAIKFVARVKTFRDKRNS